MAEKKEKETTENIWEHVKRRVYMGIARTFKETLMDGLHSYLRDMHKYFHALCPVALEEREKLYQEKKEEIDAGMPYSGDLLLYGLTPVTIFFASEAIAGFIERFLCPGVLNEELPHISRTSNTFVEAHQGIHSMIMREIVRVAKCDSESAVKILDWFIDILPHKPYFFRGFYARATEDEIIFNFVQPHERGKTLQERWTTYVSEG